MPALEVNALLEPLSPDEPCGPDLQYDADFIALETAAQGKPEQQYGETIIPAEDPDWKVVARLGVSLLSRTKDLRVACHLARAMAQTEGLERFRDCLSLIRGYVEHRWPEVHPALDPDDQYDPTERVNIISSLADRPTTLTQLLSVPIVHSAMLGTYSLMDVRIARGDAPPMDDDPPPETAAIEAAFLDCDLESLRETAAVAQAARDEAGAIELLVTEKVGVASAVSLEPLVDALEAIRDYVKGQLASREGGEETAEAGAAAVAGEPGAGAPGGAPGGTAEVRSREDVVRALDRICQYYERHEPSSPVPLLLKRAKRLVTKSFLDILEDLTPEGLSQARMIGGVERGDDDE